MSNPVTPRRSMRVDEYLRFEASTRERHEFVAGEVYATGGATRRHNRIVSNIVVRLGSAALDGQCEVFAADMKVRVDEELFGEGTIPIPCLDAALSVDAIYRGVQLPAVGEPEAAEFEA